MSGRRTSWTSTPSLGAQVLAVFSFVDVSDIFCFFLLGEGEGESEAPGGGEGSVFN